MISAKEFKARKKAEGEHKAAEAKTKSMAIAKQMLGCIDSALQGLQAEGSFSCVEELSLTEIGLIRESLNELLSEHGWTAHISPRSTSSATHCLVWSVEERDTTYEDLAQAIVDRILPGAKPATQPASMRQPCPPPKEGTFSEHKRSSPEPLWRGDVMSTADRNYVEHARQLALTYAQRCLAGDGFDYTFISADFSGESIKNGPFETFGVKGKRVHLLGTPRMKPPDGVTYVPFCTAKDEVTL